MADRASSSSGSASEGEQHTATAEPRYPLKITGEQAKQLSTSGKAAKDARKNAPSTARPPTPPNKKINAEQAKQLSSSGKAAKDARKNAPSTAESSTPTKKQSKEEGK